MFMRDAHGMLTSVIRGPAAYGLVTPETTSVAVCVYAPAGISPDAVTQHLASVAENMRLVSENAQIDVPRGHRGATRCGQRHDGQLAAPYLTAS